MFESNRPRQPRQSISSTQIERRWDPTRQQRRQQMDLIRELGQVQITPGGFLY
jgi:hypothetical protein